MIVWVILQSGLGLSTPPKGTVITIGSAMDSQQVNPLYYKQTDETSKFEQVTIHELLLQLSDSKAVIYAAAIAACMQYCISAAGRTEQAMLDLSWATQNTVTMRWLLVAGMAICQSSSGCSIRAH